ncbi:MAG: NADPH-dependent F420 reductase [Rhodospirillaceae bacterium]|nr:NADPH-dependent F420 reductase [Rhodospirillaceae bacterium]
MSNDKPSIAIIGGTGDLGSGLGLRWAKAGYPVIIGSRSKENGERAATELAEKSGGTVTGNENAAAAAAADLVVLTVPYSNHQPMLEAIKDAVQGKILVDVTVPLMPPKVMRVQLPEAGSAAKAAQDYLGENVRVVSAFQNIAADLLQDLTAEIECEVLVCGNKKDARAEVVALAEAAGMTAWHAGAIGNSAAAEALTSLLIFINKNGPVTHAGIRVTGDPKS